MITPLDIQNKAFIRVVRGYKEEDVDSFLDLVTLDLEKIIDENQKLKAQVKKLSVDLEKYKGSEGAVLETLEAAKALMSDISASSEKRAEILLKNAALDAELITREAKESVERLREEAASMETRVGSFRNRYRSLLETELEKFDSLTQELFSEMQFEDWKGMEPEKSDLKTAVKQNFKSKGFKGETMDLSKTIMNIRNED